MEYRCNKCDRTFDNDDLLQHHKCGTRPARKVEQPARERKASAPSIIESALDIVFDYTKTWCNVYLLTDKPYRGRIRIFYDHKIAADVRSEVFKDTAIMKSSITSIKHGVNMNDTAIYTTERYRPWVEKVDNDWIYVKAGGSDFIWWGVSEGARDA